MSTFRLQSHNCSSCTKPGCPAFNALQKIGVISESSTSEALLPTEIFKKAASRPHFPWLAFEQLIGEDAQGAFDCLRPHLHSEDPHDEFTNMCQKELVTLVKKSQDLPRFLFLRREDFSGISEYYVDGGNFADIFKAIWDNKVVAIKVARPFQDEGKAERIRVLKEFQKEAVYWQQLRHPHILEFYGVSETIRKGCLCLVSPFISEGNLLNVLESKPSLSRRLDLLYQAATAIEYLHSRKPHLVHGDIKPANMLVDVDQQLRICDFGMTAFSGSVSVTTSDGGYLSRGFTPKYAAPETLVVDQDGRPSPNTRKSDVFAFAMTMYQVLTGLKPMEEFEGLRVLDAIKKGKRPEYRNNIPQEMWALMEGCWRDLKVGERPEIRQIVETIRKAKYDHRSIDERFDAEESIIRSRQHTNIRAWAPNEKINQGIVVIVKIVKKKNTPSDVQGRELLEFILTALNLLATITPSVVVEVIVSTQQQISVVSCTNRKAASEVVELCDGQELRPKECHERNQLSCTRATAGDASVSRLLGASDVTKDARNEDNAKIQSNAPEYEDDGENRPSRSTISPAHGNRISVAAPANNPRPPQVGTGGRGAAVDGPPAAATVIPPKNASGTPVRNHLQGSQGRSGGQDAATSGGAAERQSANNEENANDTASNGTSNEKTKEAGCRCIIM